MKINVSTSLALPIGRRIAVRWYRKTNKGILYGEDIERHPTEPQVEDLETGVVYTFDWLYDAVSGDSVRDAPTFKDGFSDGVEEERAVVGRVASCRVFTVVNSHDNDHTIQTELTITPEEQTGAYR